MLLSVIPLDSSIDDTGLTYFAKDEYKKDIHLGSLVSVPVRDEIRYGIVSDFIDPANTNINLELLNIESLRSIINVACTTPILAPYELTLIHTLAKKYFIHAHKVLSLFLPKFVFTALEKKAFEPMIDTKDLSNSGFTRTKKLISFFHNTKNINLSEYIAEFIKKYPQDSVIIFPDDLLLSGELKNLENLTKQAIIIKNSDTYTKRYKSWLAVRKKTLGICIGTRRLLQYNLAGYEHILYIEDALGRFTHSYEHIYKNSEILESLAENGFEITIFSSIPTIESMYAIKQKDYQLLQQ